MLVSGCLMSSTVTAETQSYASGLPDTACAWSWRTAAHRLEQYVTRRHAEHLRRQRMRTIDCNCSRGQLTRPARPADSSCIDDPAAMISCSARLVAGLEGMVITCRGMCRRGRRQAHFLRRPPHSPVSDPQWAQVCRWRGIGGVTAGPRTREPSASRGLGWRAASAP